jgi:hypothetical protein
LQIKFQLIMAKDNLIVNNDFNLPAIIDKLKAKQGEGDCLTLSEKAYNFCYREMKPYYAGFQKLAGFSTKECDIKYMTIITCLTMQMYEVSGNLDINIKD